MKMNSTEIRLTSEEKALKINLVPDIYGCFAEIGAGQDVAAKFFQAGGSSGTIAYTQSAYDMKVSDAMYGETERYVSEDRLLTMLDTEYRTMLYRLPEKAKECRFFAFCNTVESLNYHKTNQGQGWIGMRFQLKLDGEPNDAILHVKLHDNTNRAQQDALGILGVNLIYGCYFLNHDLNLFLDNLVNRLPRERMEIDLVRLTGPEFESIDNRIIALNLVKKGMTEATMFDLCGNVLQPATALYKKNILLMRGRFRPATKLHIDMIESGRKQFLLEKGVKKDKLCILFELTLKGLTADGKISDKDFIDRAELLGSLGYTVMISNYLKHYKMVDYLATISKEQRMGVIVGMYNLETIFDERFYDNLPGGLFEAFGRGFGHNVKMFVYPAKHPKTNEIYQLDQLHIPVHLEGLKTYLIDNDKMEAIRGYNSDYFDIIAEDVLAKIKTNIPTWENDVPEEVAKAIKFFELFGYVKEKQVVLN